VSLWIDEGGDASRKDSQDVLHLDLEDQIAIGRAGQEATNWLGINAPVPLASGDRAMNVALIDAPFALPAGTSVKDGKSGRCFSSLVT
jgi:hypothetical protein